MSKFRILLVANLSSEIAAMEETLEKLKNIEVVTCNCVMQGLICVGRMKVNLIICQLDLPHMSGIEFLQELKSDRDNHDVPLVFLTEGFSNKQFLQLGLEIGAFDYIKKPIKEDRLLNKVAVYKKLYDKGIELDKTKRELAEVRNIPKNKKIA